MIYIFLQDIIVYLLLKIYKIINVTILILKHLYLTLLKRKKNPTSPIESTTFFV